MRHRGSLRLNKGLNSSRLTKGYAGLEGFLKNLPGTLEQFSNYLGDRKFFAADYVTFPDFHMYEMLYSHRLLAPELVNKHANLVAFIERFEKLPKIGEFLKSDKSPGPMNNKMAKFGNVKL